MSGTDLAGCDRWFLGGDGDGTAPGAVDATELFSRRSHDGRDLWCRGDPELRHRGARPAGARVLRMQPQCEEAAAGQRDDKDRSQW
ncbi:hypothetical protein GCM10022255_113670 [Dactylosporangium darangshiense]|uniref:Uncharacterized protein n=1 Tax=Dactylosporangium darangshiense TaxID=579108 RepID=A0ABP8DVQ3_9ACTN